MAHDENCTFCWVLKWFLRIGMSAFAVVMAVQTGTDAVYGNWLMALKGLFATALCMAMVVLGPKLQDLWTRTLDKLEAKLGL